MRGTAFLLLVLAPSSVEGFLPQGSREEKGKFKLSYFGREAGTEEYRLEEFEDGQVVLFSKAGFEIKVQDRKVAFLVDTVLTMDSKFAPVRYAGFQKTGAEERRDKIEWRKGEAVAEGRKPVRTSAAFLLDQNVTAQLIPILRKLEGGKKKLKVFSPASMGDAELAVEDQGEVTLRAGERVVRARELRLTMGYLEITAHVDGKNRLIRSAIPATGALAELEGFEGLSAELRPPEGVEETEARFRSGEITLAGSITRPRGATPCPAVVLLSAAGPHDRDGNAAPGKGGGEGSAWEAGDASLLRGIAYSLSAAGALVLRYDDRGCGRSEGDFAASRPSHHAADARAALAFLRARRDVASVALLGHGEGGLVALAAADEAVPAVFLLAAPGRVLEARVQEDLERTLRRQGTKEEALREILAKQRKLFAEIRKAPGDMLEIDERATFVGGLRERLAAEPRTLVARVKAAVVILQGLRDEQVPPEDADLLARARPDAEVMRFEGLDHQFRKPHGGRVDEGFLKSLAERLQKRLK